MGVTWCHECADVLFARQRNHTLAEMKKRLDELHEQMVQAISKYQNYEHQCAQAYEQENGVVGETTRTEPIGRDVLTFNGKRIREVLK